MKTTIAGRDPTRRPQMCHCCGGKTISIVYTEGGTDAGTFEEQWQCSECNAKGWIKGNAGDDPTQWQHKGALFR